MSATLPEEAPAADRYRIVCAVDRNPYRCNGKKKSRKQGGRCAEMKTHQMEKEPHRTDTHNDLGQKDTQGTKAEHLNAGDLKPKSDRRLSTEIKPAGSKAV